jgi:hypothetical protein
MERVQVPVTLRPTEKRNVGMRRTLLLLSTVVTSVVLACGAALFSLEAPSQAATASENGRIAVEKAGYNS